MSYWTNDGYVGKPAGAGDSAFYWTARGKVGGGGSLRGECINFAELVYVPYHLLLANSH